MFSPTLLENSAFKVICLMTAGKILLSSEDRRFVYDPVSYFKFQIQYLSLQDSLSDESFKSVLRSKRRGQALIVVNMLWKLEEVIIVLDKFDFGYEHLKRKQNLKLNQHSSMIQRSSIFINSHTHSATFI